MKNEITVPTSKKRTTAFIIVMAVVLAAYGVLVISLGNTHKFLGSVTELSGTVKEIVYDKDENTVYIYTDEYARPFRITSLYTVGSSPVVNGEELKKELVPGTSVTVRALNAEFEDSGKKDVYIRYLASGEKTYIDEEVAVTLILQNDQITITVGIVVLSVAFAAIIVGVMIIIFAKSEKKVDLFEFFGIYCTGPQPPEARKNTVTAVVSASVPLVFTIPLGIFGEAGNQTAATIFAVILIATFLTGLAIAIYFGIVKNSSICRNFYKELFTFSPDKLSDEDYGLFIDQSTGGTEIYRIDSDGISSVDFSAYEKFYIDFKTNRIRVMSPSYKADGFNPFTDVFDVKAYDENGNEATAENNNNEFCDGNSVGECSAPGAGSVFEEYAASSSECPSGTENPDERTTDCAAENSTGEDKDKDEQASLIKGLPIGEIPSISFEKANLRAIAMYKKGLTPMSVVVATDLEEGAFGLATDLFFILDADLYSVLKNLDVKVRGMEEALDNIEEKMKRCRR